MAGFANFSSVAAALRQRNFAYYLWGGAPSLVGIWVHRVAVAWLTWELTHSGTWLGLIAFADLFPTVVVTPVAGAMADRVDRRWLSIVSQIASMVQAVALAFLSLTGLIEMWSLFVLTAFLGVVQGINTAARLSMVPNLMERQHLPSALALDSAIFNLARFLGPALAGSIILFWGVGFAFLFNAVTYILYLWALLRLRMIRDEGGGRKSGGLFRQSFDGVRYAAGHSGIGPLLLLLIAIALGVKPFLELLPGFADDVFHRGVQGLAHLTAISGIGAFIAAIWLAQRGTQVGLTRVVRGGVALGALSILVFAATDIYAVGLTGAFFAGAAVVLCGTATQTLMQHVVQGDMRGRVMSLYGVIYRGGPALGALAMGSASEVIGLQWAVAGGGIAVAVAWVWMLKYRRTMTPALERPPGEGAGDRVGDPARR